MLRYKSIVNVLNIFMWWLGVLYMIIVQMGVKVGFLNSQIDFLVRLIFEKIVLFIFILLIN